VVLLSGNVSNGFIDRGVCERDRIACIPFESRYRKALHERFPGIPAVESIYARIESAKILSHHLMHGELKRDAKRLILTHYLYTDVDVTFARDVGALRYWVPRSIAIGSESVRGSSTQENTGVMMINRTWLDTNHESIMEYGKQTAFNQTSFDQGLIIDFFDWANLSMEHLPDEYNFKAYWKDSDEKSIVHWHGPKPLHACTQCLDNGDVNGGGTQANLDACAHDCPEPYLAIFSLPDSDFKSFVSNYRSYVQIMASVCTD